jgi:hypothetical protein
VQKGLAKSADQRLVAHTVRLSPPKCALDPSQGGASLRAKGGVGDVFMHENRERDRDRLTPRFSLEFICSTCLEWTLVSDVAHRLSL